MVRTEEPPEAEQLREPRRTRNGERGAVQGDSGASEACLGGLGRICCL